MQPETRYVKSPRGNIAYQVIGSGPRDLVYLSGMITHLDLTWDFPEAERYLTRLASFSRLILFDHRGTGISEAIAPTEELSWQGWADDLRDVLDEVGSTSAAVLAERDAGSIGMHFAATDPQRVSALILANTSARYLAAPDYPCGESRQVAEQLLRTVRELWGSERMTTLAMPSRAHDQNFLRVSARFQRASSTPSAAARLYQFFFERDVRLLLPQIQCPALVMHRREYPFLNIGHAHYLQQAIKGAKLIEIDGGDSFFSHDRAEEVLGYIEEFLTGTRAQTYAERVLATVLFVDIASSTKLAAKLGDSAWRDLAARFHAMVRTQLHRFHGREVDAAGDGVFATFATPAAALRAAIAIRSEAQTLGLSLRAGLHAGECEVAGGIVRGMAVHIGARVLAEAERDEILVSSTVKDLVTGSDFEFKDRGKHQLKGVPGAWRLFSLDVRS